jgi:PilZ domain
MPEETNEGIAYLRALKQSTGQAGGTAPTPALESQVSRQGAPVQPDDQFTGADKRRSLRYKCEGSAQLREEGVDIHTWVSFTDVSMHGCYVEAQATYPAGTVLHMKLEANGMRVETKGKVVVNYPYLGMGISFEDMSEENKAHLKRLLGTLAHRCVIMGPGIASSLPANGTTADIPMVSDPGAAIQAIVEFFESRQVLMREDFLRVLKKSQNKS